LSQSSGTGGWLGPLIILGICGWIFYAGGINKAWYSLKYSVFPDAVHIDAQPSDCDFMHAPLGSKGCHYKAVVTAYNATGAVVGGDDAPKYSHDTKTGKPIISYDNGKTWDWLTAGDVPDPVIKSVIVTWVKATD
jgi:hypothetical protein